MGVIEKHEEEFCGLRFGNKNPSSVHCKHLNKAYQQWARGAHRSRLLIGECQRWDRETEPGWSEVIGMQGSAQTDTERGLALRESHGPDARPFCCGCERNTARSDTGHSHCEQAEENLARLITRGRT